MNRTRRGAGIASVLALAIAWPLAAQEPTPESSEPTDSALILAFEWEPGLSADVVSKQRMVRQGQGTDSDLTIRSRYKMEVSEHELGLLVLNHSGTLEGVESVPELPPDNLLYELYGALSGIDAGYVVSAEGELLDVVGATEAAEAFRAAMAPVFDSVASMEELAPLMQAFEQMLTPEAMMTGAGDQWGGMIWTWAGEEYAFDAVYTAESEVPSPLLPDILIPMQYELGFLERVPCVGVDEGDLRCVRLEIYSYPNPESVIGFMDEFMARLGAALGEEAIEFKRFDQENHVEVVLDPETMVPYRYRASKGISGVMVQNGTEAPFSRLDETELLFSYGSR